MPAGALHTSRTLLCNLCPLYEYSMLLHTALLHPAGALHTDHAPSVFHGSASTASIGFHTAARFTLPALVLRVAHRAFTCCGLRIVRVRCQSVRAHAFHSTFVHTVYVTGTLCVLALIRVQGEFASLRRGVYRGSCLAAPGSTWSREWDGSHLAALRLSGPRPIAHCCNT